MIAYHENQRKWLLLTVPIIWYFLSPIMCDHLSPVVEMEQKKEKNPLCGPVVLISPDTTPSYGKSSFRLWQTCVEITSQKQAENVWSTPSQIFIRIHLQHDVVRCIISEKSRFFERLILFTVSRWFNKSETCYFLITTQRSQGIQKLFSITQKISSCWTKKIWKATGWWTKNPWPNKWPVYQNKHPSKTAGNRVLDTITSN